AVRPRAAVRRKGTLTKREGRRVKLLLTYPFRLNSSTSLSGTGHSGRIRLTTMSVTFCLLPSI
ncbi:hypothetical protein, partial [Xenococcus sp. PCC 7305]|uniref:hypothetical protein n=1 Tax=Xenococcus sp. PCC 7305 TaxID=102125 RepID=UPI001EE722A7